MSTHETRCGQRALLKGVLPAACFLLLAGCAPTTPGWDAAFGESVRTATARQVMNPDASRNTDPVSGVDGRAAKEAMTRYQKSFVEKEPQRDVFTIGVSGNK